MEEIPKGTETAFRPSLNAPIPVYGDRSVCVTFDTNLIGLHTGESLTDDILLDRTRNLLPDSLVIMEVKSNGGFPPWVHNGIIAGELSQQTLSKYCACLDHIRLGTSPALLWGME